MLSGRVPCTDHALVMHVKQVRTGDYGSVRWILLMLLLQLFGFCSTSWYVVRLDLNKCSDCGLFIVAMGTIVESAKRSASSAYAPALKDVGEDTHVAFKNDSADIEDIIEDEFVIQDEVFVYLGMSRSQFCLHASCDCYENDTSPFVDELPTREPFVTIIESLHKTRPLYYGCMVVTIITLVTRLFARNVSTTTISSSASAVAAVSASISSLKSTSSVLPFTAGTLSLLCGGFVGAIQITSFRDDVTFLPPWPVAACLISGYLGLYLSYHELVVKEKISRSTFFQTNLSCCDFKNYL